MTITIDAVGRVVIPKEIRDEAGLEPGMPLAVTCREGTIVIEPRRRAVRIVKRGRLQVAEPLETGEKLTRKIVGDAQRKSRVARGED